MTDGNIPNISSSEPIWMQELQSQKQELQGRVLRQVEAKEDFQQWAEQGFNGVSTRRFRTLKEQQKTRYRVKETSKEEETDHRDKIEDKGKLDELASQFQQNNPELKAKTLQVLLREISYKDTADTLLAKVLSFYPDYSLADEALEFLIMATSGALQEKAKAAKEKLNEGFGREVRAGRNMATEAREFSKEGLGTPTGLRDMYRDVTGSPRDAYTLFDELLARFDFVKMRAVIQFLLHSLGSDLKAKGPSISRAELAKLIEDIRILQAILGVFLFFQSRIPLMNRLFQQNGLAYPAQLNFEILAREYLKLLQERYFSPDRIFQIGRALGLSEEVIAQVILYTQFRDAVRQVAPRLYRSNRHKQDVLESILDALEEVEKEEEEEE